MLFLTQNNPRVKFQDPQSSYFCVLSSSLHLPLFFLSVFLSPQSVGDFNNFLSNRKVFWGKQMNLSTILHINILPSCDGNHSQNLSKVPGQTQKDKKQDRFLPCF